MDYSAQRIYLSTPHMGGEELDYVHDAFQKNWIAPLGENVDGFEEDLQNYTRREHVTAVTSGTAAMHLALIICDVQPGDEVICQSLTFAATANPIKYQGATPIFVDSEAETWNMDPQLLEQTILDRIQQKGEKPKAIIVVHLYGMPAKIDSILKIGQKYDIPVIEDAAEALGASVNGRKCGNFGKLSILSFNGNKIITTSGGGALLGNEEGLISKARFLSTQARDPAPHYQHSELGYNYRMSNIVAGIGRGQIKVLDKHVEKRRSNHNYYFEELNGNWLETGYNDSSSEVGFSRNNETNGIYFLQEPDGYFSNRWLTTILVNPEESGGITREHIRLSLAEQNIECRPLWKPMHQQPLYKDSIYYGNGLSDTLFKYGLCLPSGSNLTEQELSRIVDSIKVCLREYRSQVI
ncbi:DegT/DnrJ/EryC1/StrS family aminotransferase [Fodinibius salsisoli]|uniref:Aminotransferase class I/II-fold pyridoxal phosphate-dependent enzyme n=1 Tax=Fodinibius salsisoli TaxID=2820877 RepID=A0ABT3PNC5_9BACT|nr:aminotransferase class I/II-fold pyridoxal phosphate-dependent enzyme [Fodinibius salsisoli]MCW9706779.1 aminotransferase class I/II-fold pyridoxal phosphate-dependent enzyme [Fodinibius salsisoli]